MKSTLIVFLVLCTFAAAMVPRDRRALNTEDEPWFQSHSKKGTETSPEICARKTPCAWTVYRPPNKSIEYNITNTYCLCGDGTVCTLVVDDSTANAYIYYCRLPTEESKIIET